MGSAEDACGEVIFEAEDELAGRPARCFFVAKIEAFAA